ncbi:hypothetical protein KY284_031608 [Solanum tuberosum]|nr:hypothetical protein KY284_031608 [Solanum tuberosum]
MIHYCSLVGGPMSLVARSFRFWKFWTEATDFKELVRDNWRAPETDDVFISWKHKTKSTKIALAKWSKEKFGDIFNQLKVREDIVRIKEDLIENNPSVENRMVLQHAQAELRKYLHYEEEYWKQKAGIQ